MLRRVALTVACLALPLGCVTGGEGEIDPSVSLRKDSGGSLDDADEEPDAEEGDATPKEETSSDPDSESPADDSGTTEADSMIFPPDDSGCTPSCPTCGGDDGCGGTCMVGACAGGGTCAAGSCVTPTRSFLSPADYAFGSAWAKGITWTIGSEGPSTIVYTVDGSTPGPGSPTKASPADLFIGTSGTVIKWYADNGAKESTVHSFTANILTSGQTSYGFIVDKVSLGGKGPVIVASPGAAIKGTANYQGWTSTGCPMCRMQIVYGVGSTSAGCLYDYSPNNWPGVSNTGSISVTAPSAPGTYKLQVTYTLQTSCANGMATNPLDVRPTAQVATIIVK